MTTSAHKKKKREAPPTLAIVGRPNVGKSTLFNRLVGQRRSIVGDEPGITRDRIYGTTEWNGRSLRVVDTGGVMPDDKEVMLAAIFEQASVALEEADAIIQVVDGRTALTSADIDLARLLIRGGKPVFLAVNKMDTLAMYPQAEEYRRLGIREVFPISAEHGQNIVELLEAVMAVIPEGALTTKDTMVPEGEPANAVEGESRIPEEIKVAIIGRPNVGKSTLLNHLTGTERAIVSPVAGTTRDAVDEVVTKDGQKYRFIDTAGIRRKGKTKLMAEKLSVVMARKHLEAADVALLMIDATEGVTALDANIGGYAHESGRSVIVVVNKWDLVGPQRTDGKTPADRERYEEQVRHALKYLEYAPVVFLSAVSGKNVSKVFELLKRIAVQRYKRVTTGEMNRFLKHVDFERASVPMKRRVRIYYLTQAHVAPPTFILFTDRDVPLHFSYQRFIENQIRKEFGFEGTPIWIKTRPKKKA